MSPLPLNNHLLLIPSEPVQEPETRVSLIALVLIPVLLPCLLSSKSLLQSLDRTDRISANTETLLATLLPLLLLLLLTRELPSCKDTLDRR